MAVLADNCPEIKVSVVDINKEKIKSWNNVNLDDLPVYEPGLSELIKKIGIKLIFSVNLEECISEADIILFQSILQPNQKA